MSEPKNLFHLGLKDQESIVELTIRACSPEMAVKIYESLELWLIELQRIDLENDWQQDDNPDGNQG
ncbi:MULTISPECIES: hypothetical protein [unclassified Nostoc]|uniref:hypothetical protein n=1 Tax=unclassified Nostoc TaxID=2593658 RepID=UPI002AD5C192|nr:hypothetical protein [Nostoc sp. DedQUE02]